MTKLLLFSLLLAPLALKAQSEPDTNRFQLQYRMYDPRLGMWEKDKNPDMYTPPSFTNRPLYNSLDEVPDSVWLWLSDTTRTRFFKENDIKL